MKVTVNKDRCKECGLCIHHCPRKAISKCDVLNANGYYPVQVDDEACIACGLCYITSTYQDIQKGRLNDSWQR